MSETQLLQYLQLRNLRDNFELSLQKKKDFTEHFRPDFTYLKLSENVT